MKIKRFKNIWTMGLILVGAFLTFFYVLKIFFPNFIIGVAEIPAIVKVGEYVDTHLWATLLFHFVVAYVGNFVFVCACSRKKWLNKYEHLVMLAFTITGIAMQYILIDIYVPFTYVMLVLMPFVIMTLTKNVNTKTFISTTVCFSIDIMAQAFSKSIRDIVILSNCVNTATMTILLIDGFIWRILLYLFFNNMKGE